MTISPCPVVTVTAPPPPANLTCTQFNVNKTTCVGWCSLGITAKWKNTGGTAGLFQPQITINGAGYPIRDEEMFQPGEEKTYSFYTSLLEDIVGVYTLCPIPNPDNVTCPTVTVT